MWLHHKLVAGTRKYRFKSRWFIKHLSKWNIFIILPNFTQGQYMLEQEWLKGLRADPTPLNSKENHFPEPSEGQVGTSSTFSQTCTSSDHPLHPALPWPSGKNTQTESDKAINDFTVAFDGKEFWWPVHIHTWEEVQLHMARKERWVWEKNKGPKSLLADITQK